MIDEIIASRDDAGLRIALREAGRLMELLTEDGEAPGAVGDVILGRVATVMKGMDACFVEIGAERAGFLSLAARGADRDGPPPVHEGEAVLVQVTKAAQAGKGAGLTRNVSIAGRYLVLTPNQGGVKVSRRIGDEAARARLETVVAGLIEGDEGFILRTAAADAGADALAADAAQLRARWAEIRRDMEASQVPCRLHAEGTGLGRALRDRAHDALRRIVVDDARDAEDAAAFCDEYLPGSPVKVELWEEADPVFEALGIEDDIDDALEPTVSLPCGGTLIIEETHALTAIDVNTARNTGRSGHAATVRATNLEAADEIARQLRLRSLGGMTVIDFVHMDDADDRAAVLAAFNAALGQDPAFIRATGFSELGLVELARRRGAGPLAERVGAYDAEDGADR